MPFAKPTQRYDTLDVLLMGGIRAEVVLEALRLHVYDLLETPQDAAAVQAVLDTDARATRLLLEVLADSGLLVRENGAYRNTPLASEFLVTTSPFYQGQAIAMQQRGLARIGDMLSGLLRHPGRLPRGAVGKAFTAAENITGMGQHALRGYVQDAAEFIAGLPGFFEMRQLCDVGGNHGRYSMALLDRNAELQAVLADLPEVAPVIEKQIAPQGYGGRLRVIPCNLRTGDFPQEPVYDLVLVSHLLHLFRHNLEETVRTITAAVVPGGWFVSHHMNPDNHADPAYTSLMSLFSYLMADMDHFIPLGELGQALEKAGFSQFRCGATGPMEGNLILAAQKQR